MSNNEYPITQTIGITIVCAAAMLDWCMTCMYDWVVKTQRTYAHMIADVRRFDLVISKSWIPSCGWNAQLLNHDSRRKERKYQCTLNWVSACLTYSNAKAWQGPGSYRFFWRQTNPDLTQHAGWAGNLTSFWQPKVQLLYTIQSLPTYSKKKLNKENTVGFFEGHWHSYLK